MERLRISSEQVRTILKDGTEVVAHKIEPQRSIPGETSLHEAEHTAAADVNGGIVQATKIPDSRTNSLGTTHPVRLTPTIAAAAGAMGYGGTSYDRFLTEYYFGIPWETAKASYRSMSSGNRELVKEIATVLEEKGTITQYHVDEAKKKVAEIKQGIYPMKVEIYQSGRKVESITTMSRHGEVVIPHLPVLSESRVHDRIKQ